MKRIISSVLLIMFSFAIGVEPMVAKEKEKNEVAVFLLTPAPVCQNCVNKITSNLRFEKGVKDISVNLAEKNVTLIYSPKSTNPENLAKALKKIGYTATQCDSVAVENIR